MAEINNTGAIPNTGKDIEQKELSNIALGHVSLYNHTGILSGNYLLKFHLHILYEPEFSLQAFTVIRNLCTLRPVQECPCWHKFIMTQNWKQPKYPSLIQG